MNPRYPVYVPTKGRWDTRLTIRALDEISVPYKAVIEPQEVENYIRAGVKEQDILVLPHRDKGLVVTRNWIWNHALASGTARFWTIDDNIGGFYRLNHNLRVPIKTGTLFRVAEDFVDRFENVPIAGFQYCFFANHRKKWAPFYLNRRVYSNMLIETKACDRRGKPFRNEGFYNDDTDLCLRVLKNGYCTILFYAFLIKKMATMTIRGGMTPHYQGGGRLEMAEELAAKHPDVATITRKWGRWQHQVDYRRFRNNRPILKPDVRIANGTNEYGMVLERLRMPRGEKESALWIPS